VLCKYKGEVELTSGTMKLMAIFSQRRRSKTRGLLEEVLVEVLRVLAQRRRQKK